MSATTVVGHGQLGAALARGLAVAGAEARVWTRGPLASDRREPAVRYFAGGELAEAVRGAACVVLAVPDSAVADVARRVAEVPLEWEGGAVLHPSGALGHDVLAPLAARGAGTAVCHPLRAFPGPPPGARAPCGPPFAGCPFTVEGSPAGEAAARELVRRLGGTVLRSRIRDRVGYHLAAAVASNYGLLVRHWAARRFREAGLDPEDAEAAADALGRNALDNAGGTRLRATGPIRRDDVATVRAHLARLSGSELAAYSALGLLLLDRLGEDGAGPRRGELRRFLEAALEEELAAAAGQARSPAPEGGAAG